MIGKLLGSKKAIVTFVGLIFEVIAVVVLLFGVDVDNETKIRLIEAVSIVIATIVAAYNIGQGIADKGKEAEITRSKLMRGIGIMFIFSALVMSGCTVDQAFVKSEGKTRDAISPEYKKYVIDREPVPEWTDEEKEIRQATLDQWDATIKAAGDDDK